MLIDELLHSAGCFRCSTTAPGRFDLESVEIGWIVRCRDNYSADCTQVFDSPGNHWRWLCFRKHTDSQAVPGHDLGCVLCEMFRKKATIKSDDDETRSIRF